jgi:PKD repeat protein
MKTIGTVLQSLGALVLSLFGLRGASTRSAPLASFQISPPGPVVGQAATFVDTSPGPLTSRIWDFGDGSRAYDQDPTHVYAAAGHYVVTLRVGNNLGSSTASQEIAVTTADTLRLNATGQHAFLATLAARDPRTNQVGAGFALPQTDVFGYFSIPSLTGNPDNPEVFVKLIDGTFVNGRFWVFYGGLTDLEYTLSVQDELTGQVQSYVKPAGSADGGFDTSAFPGPAAGTTAAWMQGRASAASGLLSTVSSVRIALQPKLASQPLIEMYPPNPVQNQYARLNLWNPPGGIHDWVWTLPPGILSFEKEPLYAFPSSGTQSVQITDLIGGSRYRADFKISPPNELRLLPSTTDEFTVSLTARNPRTYQIGQGYAFSNGSLYGSFSLPDFTGNPNNAEVIVKLLDGRPVNGNFWEFHGGLTDVQWTMKIEYKLSNDLSISKYYFKDSYSKTGGYDTAGFDAAEQPTITSISPTSGPFGTTIRILGTELYGTGSGSKLDHFFDDSVGHLRNEKYPLAWVAGGYDPGTGLNFVDVQPTNPSGEPLTGALTMPISLVKDHYLATAPQPFTILPGVGPTVTSIPATPSTPTVPPTTQTPATTPTPTPTSPQPTITSPPPTATIPAAGAPVITGTSTDDVSAGTMYDIFGMNLGACTAITATLQGTNGVFTLICQFGDGQSVQVQVPIGIPIGTYHTCVTRQNQTGCASFDTRVH